MLLTPCYTIKTPTGKKKSVKLVNFTINNWEDIYKKKTCAGSDPSIQRTAILTTKSVLRVGLHIHIRIFTVSGAELF